MAIFDRILIGTVVLAISLSVVISATTRTELSKAIPEGFDVTLTCNFQNVLRTFSIHWTIPGISGRTLQETTGRYTVSSFIPATGEGRGWSKLTVTTANDSDVGQYRCQLLDGGNNLMETSITDLSVVKFDISTQSACWVEPTNTVVEGTETEFKCATKQTNDIPINWKVGTADLGGEDTITPNITFLNQTLAVPLALDQTDFFCDAERKTLCSTRVNILYAPRVTVSAFGDIFYGSDARYNCTATGKPAEGFTYRWYYADLEIVPTTHHRFNRVMLENNNQTLVLPDLSERFDKDISLTCTVTSAIGIGSNEPFYITGKVPRSVASVVGPILLAVIIVLICVVLLTFYFWRQGQRRVVRHISTKRKAARVRRTPSELPTSTSPYINNASFVPVSPMDLEAIGYGPDISSKPNQFAPSFDRDSGVGDDGIRPIPSRRGSISSSLGKVNRGYNYDEQDEKSEASSESPATSDPYELKMKSYSYEVNPNFNTFRKSQTLDIFNISTPTGDDSDTETKTIPSDSDDDGHIASTDL